MMSGAESGFSHRTPECVWWHMRQYYVYLMANRWGSLYIGVTNDLVRRVHEHKNGTFKGFTSKYQVNLWVYFETTPSQDPQ
jgi:putative endonuclease